MKVVVVIFAGGVGRRMRNGIPKQFLEYNGKPVLVYTIEKFNNSPLVDSIVVVCVKDWIERCFDFVKKFKLDKVESVIPGGENGQQSIFNGLKFAIERYHEKTIVMIHDGVRPFIYDKTIEDNIACVLEHGNAVTSSPAIETVFICENSDRNIVEEIVPRSKCQVARAPQSFYLDEIYSAHLKANSEGLSDFIDSASLMKNYGYRIYTVQGPDENIKITTPMDFFIFKGLMNE